MPKPTKRHSHPCCTCQTSPLRGRHVAFIGHFRSGGWFALAKLLHLLGARVDEKLDRSTEVLIVGFPTSDANSREQIDQAMKNGTEVWDEDKLVAALVESR